MFHLYFLLTIRHGTSIQNAKTYVVKLEKNQVVSIDYTDDPGEVNMQVPISKSMTVNEFLGNGEKFRGPDLWVYDPVTANCQDFVWSLLRGNNLNTPELEKFVKQDATFVLTGYTRKLSSFLTDIAGRADIILHGSNLLSYDF